MATSEFNYLKGLFKGAKLKHATKALSFMLQYHGEQKRNDGSPYYVHPVKVAAHLAALDLFKNDPITLDVLMTGALLHDILEDTAVTEEELTREFSAEITAVIVLLTKYKGYDNNEYYLKIRTNLLSALIKIADRCNNVSTMSGVFKKPRLEKYLQETDTMVKPLIRYVRDNFPDVSNPVVTMNYHIESVTNAIKVMLPLMANEIPIDKAE